ncbi:hypothetical protein PG997_010419, partial [Apiospora hydei]
MAHNQPKRVVRPRGYPKLAGFMVEHDYAILRQFRKLAVRDLLYLQAEICELEHDLMDQGISDANASNDRQYYDRDWWRLHQGQERGTGGEQWKLVLKQYQSMNSYRRPSPQQRKQLHKYISCPSLGGVCDFSGRDLGEHDSATSVYDQVHQHDLLSLREDTLEDDFLSRLMVGPMLRLFHQLFRIFKRPLAHDEEMADTALWHYPDKHIRLVSDLIGSVVSSLLPMLSIIALFYVEHTLARLGLVCAFTVVFSLFMFVTTKCRRVEIFAATA